MESPFASFPHWDGKRKKAAKRLAEETGGLAFFVMSRERDLRATVAKIVADLQHQVVLEYATRPEQADQFRQIRVESTRKGLRVATARAHYGP